MSRPFRIPARFERRLLLGLLSLPLLVLRRLGKPRVSPEGFELDPQVAFIIELMRLTKEPDLTSGSVADARERLERTGPVLDFNVPSVTAEDRFVPGGAGERRARIYTPAQKSSGALVWFHGGGFVLGSIESHDGICRKLADAAGVTVISIDYRLAPEHRFPAAFDDAVAATRWAIANAASLGFDPRKVAVGGDSAGGNLTAVTTRALARDDAPVAFQLLVYPAVDLTRAEPSHRSFAEGYLLTGASMSWFIDRYVESPDLGTHPDVSPIFAADLSGLAPALVITAGFDPLRDEGRKYAARLREAGNQVEHVEQTGMVHGFFNMGAGVRAATETVTLVANRLRAALG